MDDWFLYLVLCCLIVAAVVAWNSIVIVTTGEMVLVEHLGKYCRTLEAGVYFIIPLLYSVKHVSWKRRQELLRGGTKIDVFRGYRIRTRESTYDFPSIRVVTFDRLEVEVNGIIFYRIVEPARAVYEIDDLWQGMEQMITTSIRNTVAGMTIESAIAGRKLIQKSLLDDFLAPSKRWGLEITQLEIQSVVPPTSILKSNEKLVCARREAEASLQHEQAKHDSEILRKKTEQEVIMISAESEGKRTAILASSESNAIKQRTKVEAESVLTRAEAAQKSYLLKKGAEREHVLALKQAGISEEYLIQIKQAEIWAKAMKKATTIVVPYEAAKFLGATQIVQSLNQPCTTTK